MITANEIKIGSFIENNGDIFIVTSLEHVKPGKGGAFMQVSMQNIKKRQKIEKRFRVEEKVNVIDVYEVKANFALNDGRNFVFYTKNGNEILLHNESMDEKKSVFLKEGEEFILLQSSLNDDFLDIKIPQEVICIVKEAAPYIRGQSEANNDKFVVLDNGLKIKAPQYIKEGDSVKIKTADLLFVSRV